MITAARGIWHRLKNRRAAPSRISSRPKAQKLPVRLPPRLRSTPSRYLAVTAIVKNEGPYLREWIEFQRLMGAEHVYLYDNGSTDCSAKVVAPFVAEGFVTVLPWITFDDEVSPQRQAYAHALCNFGPEFRWMAFIDLDEFLFPVTAPDLVSLLPEYEDCCSLCVPWFMFGTSGHESPPPGLVIENYTERARFPPPPPRKRLLKWKSIVDPRAVIAVNGVHLFDLVGGTTGGVDETKTPVSEEAEVPSPSGSILRINHYYTRSHHEFIAKLDTIRFTTAGSTHRAHPDAGHRQRIKESIESDIVQDETILRFLPALRRCLDIPLESPSRDVHRTES